MILEVEGQRMAEFVLVPFEIDPGLIDGKMPTGVITDKDQLTMIFSPEMAKVPAMDTMMMGYVSTASTEASVAKSDARSMNNVALRFLTPQDATAAAEQMSAAAAVTAVYSTGTLPGSPNTTFVRGPGPDGGEVWMAFTATRSFVVYQWYGVGETQNDKFESTLVRGTTDRVAMINKFPAAPTKAEAQAAGTTGSTRPLMDQNHILIYAIPLPDSKITRKGTLGAAKRAVYGPRGMAHTSTNPPVTYEMLRSTGSTANAVEGSVVYRADTPDGATKIYNEINADITTRGGASATSPTGLPQATCSKNTTAGGTEYHSCLIQNGRYLGYTDGKELTEAQQKISAQYLIFQQVDQNAR